MRTVRDISIGEFRLKCLDCNNTQIYVTGANLLDLGDKPYKVSCKLCRKSNLITVERPTVMDLG